LDAEVAAAFSAALERLETAGARIVDVDFPELEDIPALGAAGGFSPIEGYAAHADLFERIASRCDPRVMSRFMLGRAASSCAYAEMIDLRGSLIRRAGDRGRDIDAMVFPTTPMVPPKLGDLQQDEAYTVANGRAIRNAAVANILDRCAISIPCHTPGSAPVGFTLMMGRGADRALLALAEIVEATIRGA
jgi:aspartyl-tRNA(Asn)/glutamyl-tRNA(Gln) amidotransferase subunit A